MTKEQIQEFTLRTTQANHTGLMLVMVDVERVYINDAIGCYAKSDLEGYKQNIELAKRVHQELMDAINPANEGGARLLRVLRYMYSLLATSQSKRMPHKLEDCLSLFDNIYKLFTRLNELDTDEAVMKNTHQVYAGLTYGKGFLNESLGDDYRRRGFTV